jgi:hypothetical protein
MARASRQAEKGASRLNHETTKDDKIAGTPYSPKGWESDPARKEKNGSHLEAMETATPKPIQPISLPTLDIRLIDITLIGDASLIVHKWSEKAIKQMLDKQMGIANAGKEHKDPRQDYESSLYRFPDGRYGFPTIAFKNAAVSACTSLGKSVTKVAARQSFHVIGELVEIEGTPQPREDMVRVGMGTADIRYRGEFLQWKVRLQVRFNARVLSAEQVVNLFNTAGFAVGVGEWRSERDGSHGLFHVAHEGEC